MRLSDDESEAIKSIAGALADGGPSQALREQVGVAVTRLLHADFMASYVWDPVSHSYGSVVSINHPAESLRRYEEHYQFHDPVTPIMAARKTATVVDAVIDRSDLERSEFYRDFLAADGQHHGINYFAYRGDRHLGDLRIWRGKNREPFTEQDQFLLEIVGRSLAAQLPTPYVDENALPETIAELLTEREVQIVEALVSGLPDSDIALRFHISHATVRTHLAHVFDKLQVRSRLGVVSAVRRAQGG